MLSTWTFARVPLLALAAASAACLPGSSELESVTAEPHTVSTTQALDDGSITAINGTYGADCLDRTGSWTILVSGTTATNPLLSVVKNNVDCELTLTSLVADQTYTAVSSIAMTASYADGASAFTVGDAGAVRFYANAKLDSTTFAGNFVVTVLVSGNPSAATSTVTGGVLGRAKTFAVLGASITFGDSSMNGDVGSSGTLGPLPPGQPTNGTAYEGTGSLADQAETDLLAGYDALVGMTCPLANDLSAFDLGGTLPPGVYCFDASADMTTDLVLDAGGDPSAFWVFQIASALTTGANTNVTVTNSGSACKVYWNLGSAATLGAGSTFRGTILATTSITAGTGARVPEGRLLARGAVTLDANTISVPTCE